MSQSPSGQRIGDAEQGYVEAWRKVNELLRDGRSFSGRERNCCFLNTGQSRFANVSAVSGFDLADDGRGLALVDWDQDGDLDVWTSNRTAPRVRMMQNTWAGGGHYLAVQLRGTAAGCNRDAIGARVELVLADAARTKLIRTLRAGEGYLSQSSKWLHFGLAQATAIEKLTVRWPDGQLESFGPPQIDGHYQLVQGSANPQPWQSAGRGVQLFPSATEVPAPSLRTQNLLTERVPLPSLPYTTQDARQADASRPDGKPRLVNLWSISCPPCIQELEEWTARQSDLESHLQVLLLSVDAVNEESTGSADDVSQLLRRLRVPFTNGMANEGLVDRLQIVHNVLYDHDRALPIPSSLLIDVEGNLAAVYKGPVSVDQILIDCQQLKLSGEQLLAAALPAPGIWAASPAPQAVSGIAEGLLRAGFADDALALAARLDRRAGGSTAYQAAILVQSGTQLARQGDLAQAILRFQEALRLNPASAVAHMELGTIYGRNNDLLKAVDHLQSAVRVDGDRLPDAHLNLGVALRRMGRPDEAIRSLQRALEIDARLAPAHVHLALIRASQGELNEAARHFRAAIQLEPADVQNRVNLAIALLKLQQPEEALRELEQTLEIQPDLLIALKYRCEILAKLGRVAEAIEILQQAVDRRPQDAPLRMLLARYLEQSPP